MTAMDFPPNPAHPAAPAVGEKWPQPPVPNQPVYIWDGVKWTTADSAIDDVVGPTVLLPLMDGVAATGVENNWSRGDHVHPSDTSRLAVSAFNTYTQNNRTEISLGGVSASPDITVPATAKQARLTGVLWNAVSATARLRASVTAGVFEATSGNYIVNGFGYNSLAAGDVIPRQSVAETGFLMHGPPSADNLAQPVQFDAVITLSRSDPSRVFNCESRCGFFSGFDNWHFFLTTYMLASVGGGTPTRVLALRLVSTSNWLTDSYVTVEWLGQ